MRFTTALRRARLVQRFSSGAGLMLMLVAIVIMPLCSASGLCGKPCCHRGSSLVTSAASPSSCCTVRQNDPANRGLAISPAATWQDAIGAAEASAILDFVPVKKPPAIEVASRLPHPPDCPRHILNSTFLV
jgi:hypothetical protein